MTALAALPEGAHYPETQRAPARAGFSLPGYSFMVQSEFLEVVEYLRHVFAEFSFELDPGAAKIEFSVHGLGPGYVVEQKGSPPAYFSDWRDAADYVQLQASQAALSRTDHEVALHAAGVSRNRRALLIAGPSGAGKSTLTLALLRRGYDYLSDEAALLSRETGLVRGFARAIGVVERRTRLQPVRVRPLARSRPKDDQQLPREVKRYYHASVFGAAVDRDSLPVMSVVLLDGLAAHRDRRGTRPEDADFELMPLGPAEALPRLLRQVFARGPADVILDALVRLVHSAGVYRLIGGGTEQAADAIAELVNPRSCPSEPHSAYRPTSGGDPL